MKAGRVCRNPRRTKSLTLWHKRSYLCPVDTALQTLTMAAGYGSSQSIGCAFEPLAGARGAARSPRALRASDAVSHLLGRSNFLLDGAVWNRLNTNEIAEPKLASPGPAVLESAR